MYGCAAIFVLFNPVVLQGSADVTAFINLAFKRNHAFTVQFVFQITLCILKTVHFLLNSASQRVCLRTRTGLV